MAYIEKTAFEVYVSNSMRNGTQNITGKFGSFSGETFTPDVCSAGFLCTKRSLLPNEGYENVVASAVNATSGAAEAGFASATGLKNGNSYYMVAAANGKVSGYTGDHTGLYFGNTYDVAKGVLRGMNINIPGQTLGLPIPADERGDFTEAIVGEKYNVGSGNFSTAPTASLPYATVVNGLLVAQAAAPTDGSVYFEITDTDKRFTEGAYDGGQKITLLCLRSAVVAPTGN